MGTEQLIKEVEERIELEGSKYTSEVWKMLKAKNKTLTPDEAAVYHVIQKAHIRLTGHSLPDIKGARKTRAQIRNELGPEVKDEVIEKAVQSGLAAKLKQMRGEV